MKIKKGTIIRTILLAVALVNQILTIAGKSPLPISDEQIETLVSTAITVVIAVINWWKNNSFTSLAIEADEMRKCVKKSEV